MSDSTVRFGVTFGLLALFIVLERIAPARPSALSLSRFSRQAGLALVSAILARMALAGGLASVALWAQVSGVGLFNVIAAPPWLAFGASLIAMDFAVWGQHLALHRVPFLWRLHRVHHGDTVMDVSTALRFHPFEIVASLMFKASIVVALGAPAEAAFAFEIMLGAAALFSHANVALPAWLERHLQLFLITPSLHLIHHSPNPMETNSNFGFSTCLWDRLFGTYRHARLHDDGRVGLEAWRAPEDQKLKAMLINPLR